MKKVSLYKFTNIHLLKNYAQLKTKKIDKEPKKINHLNLLKNKITSIKKSHLNKKQKTKEKKKILDKPTQKKEEGNTHEEEKKKCEEKERG